MTNKLLIKNNVVHSGTILLCAMFLCGILAVLFGKEVCWDLANYHYYNPYALLNARTAIDFWPSSFIHQYINPTMDLLSYFLINHVSGRVTEFVLGALHGINFWLLFLINRRLLPGRFSVGLSLLFAILGMYGPTSLPGIGSFQNDNMASIFVLGFVLLQLISLQGYMANARLAKKLIFFAGILSGVGVGLKLTAGLFVLGGLLAAIILPIPVKDRTIQIILWGAAILFGMVLSAGYWLLLMWQQHHNPFFPFFNDFFHSPDFVSSNWRDMRFLPHGFLQTVFYPFYFSWDGRTADNPFRDFRFLIVYVLFFITACKWLVTSPRRSGLSLDVYWLHAFFIFSYIIWQTYFSIARYLAALEMLSPLVIYLLLTQIIKNPQRLTIVASAIFYTIFFTMSPSGMVRTPDYGATYFNVRIPEAVTKNTQATVLVSYSVYNMDGKPSEDANPRPESYLIPFFPPAWRFIGVPFKQEKYLQEKNSHEQIFNRIQTDNQKIYLLTDDHDMPALYQAARQFSLVPDGICEKVFSDRQKMTGQPVLLCPVTRIHSALTRL